MKQGKKAKQKQVAVNDAEQRIALLEKQLQWEKMIEIAEKELHVSIRKKPGAEPLRK